MQKIPARTKVQENTRRGARAAWNASRFLENLQSPLDLQVQIGAEDADVKAPEKIRSLNKFSKLSDL